MVTASCFKQTKLQVSGIWGLRLALAVGMASAFVLSMSRSVIGPAPALLVVFTVVCVRSTVGESLAVSGEVVKGVWVGAVPTSVASIALVHLIPPDLHNVGAALHLCFVPMLTLWIASISVLDPVSARIAS
jgi:hypothetical protein